MHGLVRSPSPPPILLLIFLLLLLSIEDPPAPTIDDDRDPLSFLSRRSRLRHPSRTRTAVAATDGRPLFIRQHRQTSTGNTRHESSADCCHLSTPDHRILLPLELASVQVDRRILLLLIQKVWLSNPTSSSVLF